MTVTPPSGIGVGLDVYRAVFFPLTSTGAIDAPGYPVAAETPYEGLEFYKPKTFQPNLGNPRTIPVTSQGRVQDTFLLPSLDAKTGEFHLAYIDMVTFAALTKVKTRTIGGATMMPTGTDKQGLEILGAFLISQLQFHDEDGLNAWHSYLIPRARAAVTWPAFNENPIDVTVTMSFSSTKKHVWGEAVGQTNDGATELTMIPFVTWDLPNIVAWLADGVETAFLLPTNKQAAATFADTFKVYDYTTGNAVSGTPTADKFTAGSPVTDTHPLIGFYEVATS